MIRVATKRYPEAYRAAQALCERHPLPFPLNVSHLLARVHTHTIYDVSSMAYNRLHAGRESAMLHPKKAWTLYEPEADAYLIVWNKAQTQASIRFSVAHELGHILLNHQRNWPADRDLCKRDKENEADTFARCLLAPFEAVRAQCGHRPFNARLVAEAFGIPYRAAQRLHYDYEYWLLTCE